jgi:hypothetical protein
VIDGPTAQGLDRANWTHAELADNLRKTRGISAGRSAVQRFCRKAGIRLHRPTYRFLRGDPVKQAEAREELAELRAKAEAGELVLLSQDEARSPMVPTPGATLGVKGHRPVVGPRDCKGLLHALAVVAVITAAAYRNTLESPARAKRTTGRGKTRRQQEAFAAHLRHVGRLYPAESNKRVVLIIDNAPWHPGQPIDWSGTRPLPQPDAHGVSGPFINAGGRQALEPLRQSDPRRASWHPRPLRLVRWPRGAAPGDRGKVCPTLLTGEGGFAGGVDATDRPRPAD